MGDDGASTHADEPILVSGAPARAARVAVVALHGRGATAQGVVNLLDPVYRHGVAFFAPAAARNSWYPESIDAPLASNEPHLSDAVERVDRTLERAEGVGIPAERTVLVGFSQGGSVAAEFAIRRPRRYGGVFVLSGAVPGDRVADGSPTGDLGGTPVRFGGHANDPVVDRARVRESARVLEALGGEVTVDLVDGEAHAVTDADFDALETLLEDLLESEDEV